MKVLGITGSLRAGSNSSRLLEAASRAMPAGAVLEAFDGIRDLPVYDEDLDTAAAPAPVQRLRDAIAGADAVLFVTPEYNGSVPGGLKNAVDWASRPREGAALKNKTVAAISSSPGQFGGVWAQADLRRILGIAGARVLDREFAVAKAHEAFDEDGRLADPARTAELADLLGALVEEARPVYAAAA